MQFINTAENLRFDRAEFTFSSGEVHVEVYPPKEAEIYTLQMSICCLHRDWQVSSMAQIFNSHSQIFSTVEHLALEQSVHSWSAESRDEADRTEWRQLLELFTNVKTLRVNEGLVKQLSRSLRVDDGEHPLELLPLLQELTHPFSREADDAFASFFDVRQNAGRPVTQFHPIPSLFSCSSSPGLSTLSEVMSGNCEAGGDLDT
ncbi:hypothetical protein DFH94DRAFT_777384 [Russula ochroleuca]|uniref:Uncharacterized protein n=1 Tax=Russula ochroleuca TaxID=152965 RepID=A0A9P5JXQ2_9AGAM|nr:hypothetical protein DFH94DRAFT_777384 [Russula ochroleuca]